MLVSSEGSRRSHAFSEACYIWTGTSHTSGGLPPALRPSTTHSKSLASAVLSSTNRQTETTLHVPRMAWILHIEERTYIDTAPCLSSLCPAQSYTDPRATHREHATQLNHPWAKTVRASSQHNGISAQRYIPTHPSRPGHPEDRKPAPLTARETWGWGPPESR